MSSTLDIRQPEWLKNAPALPDRLPKRWGKLWDQGWALLHNSARPPLDVLDDIWISVGTGYFMPVFGHWDIVHIVHDLLAYDVDLAASQILLVIKTLRDPDGQLPAALREYQTEDGSRHIVPELDFTCPPLWPVGAWSVFRRSKDLDFLLAAYNGAAKGLPWFERNRRLPIGLFWAKDSVGGWGWETGLDINPRWDDRDRRTRPRALIDTSCQMCMYYDSIGMMAETLGLPTATERWRRRSAELGELIRGLLWYEKDGMFYDRDIETGKWNRIKTVSSFWPMTAGVASADQTNRMVENLSNPKSFFTTLPVPSVAIDDPTFELDCWRGPTWLSQTYWVMRGLHRCGYHDLAKDIGTRVLDGAAKVLDEHGTILEFYHPQGGPISELKRKGKPTGPARDYIGHNPIHAIAMNTLEDWR